MATDLSPYSTALQLMGKMPEHVADEMEKQRIGAYALYEAMYWTNPGTFKLAQRGSNADPVYLPSGRQIVETFHRFLAPGLAIGVNPEFGTDVNKELAHQVWTDFAAREKFYSKFNTGKRYGLIRGDWAWHIWADPEREEGSRISVYQIDPGSLFPIYDVDNIDNIIGWHIIETVLDNNGDPFISRQTYVKETGKGGPSPIVYMKALYEVDDWGGPGMEQDPKPVKMITPPTRMPEPIDALPVYVIPNFDEPGSLWGASELRGMERLFSSLNQSISDEDLALALEGVGVYATDSGTPVDENGDEVPWNLGPGRVIELPSGKKFWRVENRGSFVPYQEHMKFLIDQIDQTFGHSSVAKGSVDVTTAESGIALLLQLGPIIARAEEREVIIRDVHQQMLYGLGKWFSAFEGSAFNSLWEVTRWELRFGSKIPPNREQDFKEIMEMVNAQNAILPMSYLRDRLRKLGFDDMPEEEVIEAQMAKEATARAQIQQDAMGFRMDSEAEAFLQ